MSGFTSEGRLLTGILVVLGAMATLAAVDLASDLREGTTVLHVVAEGGILFCGALGIVFVARKLLATVHNARLVAEEARTLAGRLEETAADAARWKEEAGELLVGLSRAIDDQLERWQLTPAEKEVALLLLKGLSHKEIAYTRAVTEATARQQARAIYRKAGLSGRNDLAAFFLEDLLVPQGDGLPR